MTCREEIRRSHLHESPNPIGQLEIVLTQHHWAKVFLDEVNIQGGRTLSVNGHVFVTKASHTSILDFGCGPHKQPGEGLAPSG